MANWDSYTQKDTPEDNDTLMIKDFTAGSNKRTPFSAVWNWIVDKMTKAVISNLETTNKMIIPAINELNSKLYLPIRSLGNETDVNNYLDNYSDSFPNNTHYYTAISLTAAHPKLGGGAHLIEGYKTSGDFEWQQATTYNSAGGNTRRVRSKCSGIWSDWVTLKS